MEVDFEYNPERSLVERELLLAEDFSTVTGYRYAREVAAELLAAKWGN
jgi:hypothetical protein